jgi:hypothetical protein
MKSQKIFGCLALGLLAAATLASCGDTTGTSEKATTSDEPTTSTAPSTSESTPEEVTLTYQYVGEDASMASYGFAYSFYMNAYSDGTIDGYGYSMYSMNTTDAANNENLYKWFTGKWGKAKDDDDAECIRFIVDYADGVKSTTGDALTNKSNYYVYENSNGTLTDINAFNIPIGLSGRTTKATYNTTQYADQNAFIKGTSYKFTEPESYLAVFNDTNTYDRVYCYEEGKGYMYGSAIDPADNTRKYYPKNDVTWTYTDSKLSLIISSAAHEAVLDGKKATVSWSEALYGTYTVEHNLVCEDASALTKSAVGGDTEGPSYAAGTIYFTYNYLASYNLSMSFSATYSVWTAAVGSPTTAYTNVEGDTSELMAFTPDSDHSTATFSLKKDGSFAFAYTLAGNAISKVGTFTYTGTYSFTLTTTDGSVAEVTTSIAR